MDLALGLLIGLALGGGVVWAVVRARMDAVRAEAAHARAVATERQGLIDQVRLEIPNAVKAASNDASQSFMQLATQHFGTREKAVEQMVKPIAESLEKVGLRIEQLDKARAGSEGKLAAQLRQVVETTQSLDRQTGNLVTALRRPSTRGQWGEIQLRNVCEMAGMLAHCDFCEQTSVTTDEGRLRPDLVVTLPGGKSVVVDAKVPLEAYLDAYEAQDEDKRRSYLEAHARQMRDHITKLSGKAYWSQFDQTPEFVVMFVPSEAIFSAALEANPGLIEAGVKDSVLLATPTTLIALLRAVHYGWRQETVAESARAISRLGRDLYERIGVLGDHFAKLGRQLDGSVRAYNQTVASLEARVLPAARKFPEHGAGVEGKELDGAAQIESVTRGIQAPELLEGPDPGPRATADPELIEGPDPGPRATADPELIEGSDPDAITITAALPELER
jgi:DNA recombination protein RmuC